MQLEDPLEAYRLDLKYPVLQEWSNAIKLPMLARHIHEVGLFAALYFVVYFLSGWLSPKFVPSYKTLTPRNKLNFDMHVVSQIQAVLLLVASFPLFFPFAQQLLPNIGSYTPYSGFVIAAAAGYFVWDSFVSIKYSKYFGPGFAAHGVAALATFLLAYTPYMHNYAAPFMWFEASTPFVNVHWFATHVPGLVSDRVQKINGLILLVVFFLARIVAGPYNGYQLFRDSIFARPAHIPLLTVVFALFNYLTVMVLSYYWFAKMVQLALKALRPAKEKTN